jgi:hypothetical protein
MNDTTVDLDQTEEEEALDLFTDDVSDDALEAAAGGPGMSATMGPGSCWVPGGKIC